MSGDRRTFLRRHPSGFGVLSIGLSVTFLVPMSLAVLGELDLLDASLVRSATGAIGAILIAPMLFAIVVFISDANTNPTLSFGGRVAWIVGLFVFWVIALPVYWWRHIPPGSGARHAEAAG